MEPQPDTTQERQTLDAAIDRANHQPAPAPCMDCGHPDALDADDNPEKGA